MEISVGCVAKAVWVWSQTGLFKYEVDRKVFCVFISDALPQRRVVLDNDCFASLGYHLQKCVYFDCLEIAESGRNCLGKEDSLEGCFPNG